MASDNPTWGAPRIHGELLKLGFDVSKRTVSRYLERIRPEPRRTGSQTWSTFLRNQAKGIVAVDMFTVPTVRFEVLYVFVVLALERRRLVFANVTTNPTVGPRPDPDHSSHFHDDDGVPLASESSDDIAHAFRRPLRA